MFAHLSFDTMSFNDRDELLSKYDIRKRFGPENVGSVIDPRGGKTVVEIRHPTAPEDSEPLRGEAECSHSDAFNKSVGLQVALGRALKQLD